MTQKHTLLTLDRLKKTLVLQQQAGPPAVLDLSSDSASPTTTITASTLNPLLFAPLPSPLRPGLVDRCTMCETLLFVPKILDLTGAWHDESKMCSMLIANPAPTSIEVEVVFTLNGRRIPRPSSTSASSAGSRALWPERHSITSPTGVTFADVLRELDVVLHCAQRRWMRAQLALGKGAVGDEVGLDAKGCKVWIRGVVFPTEGEMEVLVGGGTLGGKGAVVGR